MREMFWVGSRLEDLQAFPNAVQRTVGFALWLAQTGDKHPSAKPLKGYRGAGVLEIVADDDGDTDRSVYTLTLPGAVYVLPTFQKKSKRGAATPKRELDLIRERLRWAQEEHAATQATAERKAA